ANETLLGPGRELEHELDLAGDALNMTQQLVRGIEAEVVVALPVGEDHCVPEANDALLRRERRLDHERARDVPALGREACRRGDRPVAGSGIEDAREDRRAVVA